MAYFIDYGENDSATSESTTGSSVAQVSIAPVGKVQRGKTYFLLATMINTFDTGGTGSNNINIRNNQTGEVRQFDYKIRDKANEERSSHAVWAVTIADDATISDHEDWSFFHGPDN